MKKIFTTSLAFAVLLSANPIELYAQQFWAVSVIEDGNVTPTILEYRGMTETAENQIEYYRIYDDSYKFRHDRQTSKYSSMILRRRKRRLPLTSVFRKEIISQPSMVWNGWLMLPKTPL